MQFVEDHAVAIAAVIWGVAILIGLVVLVVAGVRLWRDGRAAQRRIQEPADALVVAADRAQTRVDELSRHGDELSQAVDELSMQVRVLKELGRAGSEIAQAIRSPLRLLGR